MAKGEILFVEIGQYAFWIAVASIIGIIITSWRAVDSARGDRKLRFAEMSENFEHDFYEVTQRQYTSKNIESSIRSARDMLHILQRLAYLKKLKKINSEMIDFFDQHFSNGYTLLKLFDIIYPEDPSKTFYKHVIWWIEKKNIQPVEFEALPPKLYEIYTLTKSGKRIVFQTR